MGAAGSVCDRGTKNANTYFFPARSENGVVGRAETRPCQRDIQYVSGSHVMWACMPERACACMRMSHEDRTRIVCHAGTYHAADLVTTGSGARAEKKYVLAQNVPRSHTFVHMLILFNMKIYLYLSIHERSLYISHEDK